MLKDIILIFSTFNDISTNKVIANIRNLSKFKIVRINDDRHLDISVNSDNQVIFKYDKITISSNRIKCIWYRRGYLFKHNANNKVIVEVINLKEEIRFKEFLMYKLSREINVLGSFDGEININKLINLECARQVGLKIPESIIGVGNLEWSGDHNYIVKTISNIEAINYESSSYGVKYTLISEKPAAKPQNTYYFLQQYVDKYLDIRVFYLMGKFYSMAIFSQNNSKTRIDFRNYDQDLENRCVPFKLPEIIETKLLKLMNLIGLNTGSIDLVMTSDKEFWFLEVNPSGQFDWLSTNCNFNIEKLIAENLIK